MITFAHDVSGEARDWRGRWTLSLSGGPDIPADVATFPPDDLAETTCRHVLNTSARDQATVGRLAALAGGADGCGLMIQGLPGNVLYLTCHSRGFRSICRLEKDVATGSRVFYIDRMDNDADASRRPGLAIFVNQVRAARALGCSVIRLTAAGEFDGQMNGYYTWPRFGFDGNLTDRQFARLDTPIRKAMKAKRNLRALYSLVGGKECWKRVGDDTDCWFRLSDGSDSMAALSQYIRERGMATFAATFGRPVSGPGDWTTITVSRGQHKGERAERSIRTGAYRYKSPEDDIPEVLPPGPEFLPNTPWKNLRDTPEDYTVELYSSSANKVFVTELKDGTVGVFKPADGEDSDLRKSVKGRYFAREAAASVLAHALGVGDLVPPTVIREVGGKIGSFQVYQEKSNVAADMPSMEMYDGEVDMARAAAFDFLVGNSDRHSGNWLISESGKIRLIDHGLCFPDDKFDQWHNDELFRKSTYEGLSIPREVASWSKKSDLIEGILREHGMSDDEIGGVLHRLTLLSSAATYRDVIGGKAFGYIGPVQKNVANASQPVAAKKAPRTARVNRLWRFLKLWV